jgi:hypothetical protein
LQHKTRYQTSLPLSVTARPPDCPGHTTPEGADIARRAAATGSETIAGAARRAANEVAAQLKIAAEKQGWI